MPVVAPKSPPTITIGKVSTSPGKAVSFNGNMYSILVHCGCPLLSHKHTLFGQADTRLRDEEESLLKLMITPNL